MSCASGEAFFKPEEDTHEDFGIGHDGRISCNHCNFGSIRRNENQWPVEP